MRTSGCHKRYAASIDLAPSSVTAFNNLVNAVRNQMGKLPLQAQVVIDFDPNADYPKLTFASPEALPDELVGLHAISRHLTRNYLPASLTSVTFQALLFA